MLRPMRVLLQQQLWRQPTLPIQRYPRRQADLICHLPCPIHQVCFLLLFSCPRHAPHWLFSNSVFLPTTVMEKTNNSIIKPVTTEDENDSLETTIPTILFNIAMVAFQIQDELWRIQPMVMKNAAGVGNVFGTNSQKIPAIRRLPAITRDLVATTITTAITIPVAAIVRQPCRPALVATAAAGRRSKGK